jgi:hypothetical protein
MAEPVRDYDIIVSFLAEELSADAKAELAAVGEIYHREYVGLSYDCAADGGKGGFVKDNALIEAEDLHSGQYLHDEAEALKAFERAKQEFGSKMGLEIRAWWSDDAGECGDLAFYKQD